MKNIFAVTVLSLASILLATGCAQWPKTPADEVIVPEAAIMKQQVDFDTAMIEKNKSEEQEKGINE